MICNSARKFIGEAAHCLDLAMELNARGHSALLVVRGGSELEERARAAGVTCESLVFSGSFNPITDYADMRKLQRIIRGHHAEIVHCHRGKDHWVAAFAVAATTPVPRIVRTRHVITAMRNHAANRWLLRNRTDAVIAVSQIAADSFGSMLPLIQEKLRVVYSGVDTAAFTTDKRSEAWRASIGVEHGEKLIGLIARMQAIKGQEVFLRAAAMVNAQASDTRFLIAGRSCGTKPEQYMTLARELGIADRVIIRDWLDDVQTAMASLDVGVLASRGSEGSSRVTYEYMASGLPIVATAVGCIPEVLRDGETGLVVPPDDPDAMAGAISRILDSTELGSTLSNSARDRALNFHNRERWLREITAVYAGSPN
ncbi:MAG: glycosyltransferase family 4 protein [Candidatus Sumerlaeaceae bacterium]